MKTLNLIFLIYLFFGLVSCAPVPQTNENTVPPQNVVATSGYILSGSTKVAYVLNFQDNFAKIYIPSADKYAEINATTGIYHSYDAVYHAGAGCTGEKRAITFFGMAGKAVLFDGISYYNVDATVAGSFSYQSFSGAGGCFASTAMRTDTYSVTTITRPFDFTAILPLNVQFQ